MTKKREPVDGESRFTFERIVWIDSCEPGDNAEVDVDSVPSVQTIVQVGHLVRETPDAVSIAGGWKPELRTLDYVITIPKVAILRRDRLRISR